MPKLFPTKFSGRHSRSHSGRTSTTTPRPHYSHLAATPRQPHQPIATTISPSSPTAARQPTCWPTAATTVATSPSSPYRRPHPPINITISSHLLPPRTTTYDLQHLQPPNHLVLPLIWSPAPFSGQLPPFAAVTPPL
uniref:Uncharacterized protein n=1 Tax=Tanacetum cinerariifolium TaxID=118510 RepID=A0A699RFB8_TANCI|nr:hypothetical protein [Tanacetum cinerariifolium]